MKRVLYIIVLVLVIGCKTEKKQKPTVINSDELKSTVSFLASNQLEGRSIGSAGIERAAIYIENIFKEYNVKPYFETFRDSFNIKDAVGYNIVGYIEGNDSKLKNEFIILGAHYDHLGIINEVNGDSIANGANDNASGTSAVLALTKYFANEKTNKRSVMFILFSGEEGGLLGSEHLAKKLKSMNIDLYTMVNFEMIGVPLFQDTSCLICLLK
jgi:acetylornithine deacetylase/succinyl-diaminopimelate desuccinylase-like protein